MNTALQTPYARYSSQGREDDYGGYRLPAWYGHCDSCKLKDVSLGQVEGPLHAASWVERHNQANHEAQTRPALQATPAGLRVTVTQVCQHPLPEFMQRGTCDRPLAPYTGGWQYDQPLLACDMGHFSLPPAEDPAREQILSAALRLDSGFELAARRADLTARRDKLDEQISSLTVERERLS